MKIRIDGAEDWFWVYPFEAKDMWPSFDCLDIDEKIAKEWIKTTEDFNRMQEELNCIYNHEKQRIKRYCVMDNGEILEEK